MESDISVLEQKLSAPDVWGNPAAAKKLTQRFDRLKSELDQFRGIEQRLEDLAGIADLLLESPDEAMERESLHELRDLAKELDRLETFYFMGGEYDYLGAFLSIHPGAGGTEAQDWAQMLMRMYLRWTEGRNLSTEIVDMMPGEEAGLKSVTVKVEGAYAYGLLQTERGVHRLVRISPFDSNERRHTSFASVDVIPIINDEIKVDIKDDELRIDIFRSSGAGGQLVNKVSSAVRITHLPTNIVVQCQNQRSQLQNRASAMAVLRAKLFEVERQKQEDRINMLRGERKSVEFGNQIRSYVFMPYTLVKDLRTGLEISDVPSVMDGGIEPFITEYLRQQAAVKRKNTRP